MAEWMDLHSPQITHWLLICLSLRATFAPRFSPSKHLNSFLPPLVTLFPTSVCPYLIPSLVFDHRSAKIQSTFFCSPSYPCLPPPSMAVQIFIFPEFLPDYISCVCALPSPALLFCRSSLFVNSCIMSFSLLSLSLSIPTPYFLAPPSCFAAGTTVTCRCPLLHTEDMSFSRAWHTEKLHSCLLPYIYIYIFSPRALNA